MSASPQGQRAAELGRTLVALVVSPCLAALAFPLLYLAPAKVALASSFGSGTPERALAGLVDAGGLLEPILFVALVPWLWALLRQRSSRRAFGLSWGCGLLFFALQLYWVVVPISDYASGGRAAGVILTLFLAAFYGLFWGLAGWGGVTLRGRLGLPLWLGLPLLWMGLEQLRVAVPLLGYSLGNLGYGLVRSPQLVGGAALGGATALAGLIVLVNAGLAEFLAARGTATPEVLLPRLGVALAMMALTGDLVWSHIWAKRVVRSEASAPRLELALVQGNVSQALKNTGASAREQVARAYLPLSEAELRSGTELLVWPEAAWPGDFPLRQGPRLSTPPLARLGRASLQPSHLLLTGTRLLADGRRPDGSLDWRARRLQNAAYLLDTQLALVGHYAKRHLLPLGEYIPLGTLLPLEPLVPEMGSYLPGPVPRTLEFESRGKQVSLGVAICFDAFFPEHLRRLSSAGATLLLVLSNDAWYGQSSAPFLFLSVARMRAVENGRALVRAANSGPSAMMGPLGDLRAVTPLRDSAGGQGCDGTAPPEALRASLPLLSLVTPYQRTGELAGWGSLLLAVLMLGLCVVVDRGSSERAISSRHDECSRDQGAARRPPGTSG